MAGGVGVGWWKSAVGPSSLCLAQKIMKNDVSYMGVKKLLVLGRWRVGWGGGGVVAASCRTITIATGSKNREK